MSSQPMPQNMARCRCPAAAIEIHWRPVRAANDHLMLSIDWQEQGGPSVAEPKQRGFGSKLIEGSIAAELGGSARLAFAPEGLRCEILIPIEIAAIDTRTKIRRGLVDIKKTATKTSPSSPSADGLPSRSSRRADSSPAFVPSELRRGSLRSLRPKGAGLPSRSSRSERRLVEPRGFEPLTSSLRTRRSPN